MGCLNVTPDTLLSLLGPNSSPRENNIHFKINLVKGSAPKAVESNCAHCSPLPFELRIGEVRPYKLGTIWWSSLYSNCPALLSKQRPVTCQPRLHSRQPTQAFLRLLAKQTLTHKTQRAHCRERTESHRSREVGDPWAGLSLLPIQGVTWFHSSPGKETSLLRRAHTAMANLLLLNSPAEFAI